MVRNRQGQQPTTSPGTDANASGSSFVLAGVVACFVLSGFAALLYQTAWLRQFSLVFGTSELAVATVLAAYMGGLAAGAAIVGRWVGRIERPILVYGLLEAGIAVSALAVPLLLTAASAIYGSMLGDQPAPPNAAEIGQPIFYLIVAFVVLALPTGFMGATLPLLTRHAVRDDRQVGPRVALLYATNTAGAVVGTVVAAFLLLPALGLTATVWVGVAINALVFGIAAALAQRAPAIDTTTVESAGDQRLTGFFTSCVKPLFDGSRPRPARFNELFSEQRGWILMLISVSGANAFFYEVLWTRMLAHVMGGSIYAFATMLAAFLSGIALGGGLAGPFAKTRQNAALAFAITQFAIAVLSAAIYAWIGPLLPDTRAQLPLTLLAIAVMLPATVFIGATFPLAVRILARGEHEASAATARIYAWNTVGAIAGALLAGFYLIPMLGFAGSIKLAILVNICLALWSLAFVAERKPIPVGAVAAVGLLVIVVYQPDRPQAVIRSSSFLGLDQEMDEIYFAVGRSATVFLGETGGSFELRTNGLPEASILVEGAPPIRHSQHWLTALPVAARPDTEDMLVIGYGGGVALEGVPASVQSIDVVELEAEVINANRMLAGRRADDPLEDERVNIIFNDARNALQLTNKTYDVIVSQPSHPWTAGASHLFTREFMEMAGSRLSEDGIFLQWMNAEFVTETVLRSLTATLVDTFEYVRIYRAFPSVLMFLSSNAPLSVERDVLRTGQPITDHLLHYSYMGINGAEDLLASLALDENGTRRFSARAPLSTDDRNLMATHSRPLGDGLFGEPLTALFEPYDPLLDPDGWIHQDLGDRLNFVYIANRLLNDHEYRRAGQLSDAVSDPSTRALIVAIGYEFIGDDERAEQALAAALEANPENVEAQFKFVSRDLASFATGEASDELLAVATQLRGAPAAVVLGWPLGATQDWASLAGLDPQLAQTDVTDLWYPETVQLRADWRAKVTSDERYPFDALRLIDRALLVRPELDLYVLRAGAASALGDTPAFVESGRYVNAYIRGKLDRHEQGTYRMQQRELETTLDRLAAFDIRLGEIANTGDLRAAEVRELLSELSDRVAAML